MIAREEIRVSGRPELAHSADVVKMSVYLVDIDDRPRINPLRQVFFGPARPASTLVEVSDLAVPGAKVEIDAIAAVPA